MANNVTKLPKPRRKNQKREWTWPSFVEAWQTSESYDEVLEKLGFENTPQERSFIGVKASYARKKGVQLKKLPRKRRNSHIDWEGLADLAKAKGKS
jgi:hypothetical protein|tara:strand:- start:1166 stop:1453 length:288 start_codon:yes stop_codon:yes gene_type:complete